MRPSRWNGLPIACLLRVGYLAEMGARRGVCIGPGLLLGFANVLGRVLLLAQENACASRAPAVAEVHDGLGVRAHAVGASSDGYRLRAAIAQETVSTGGADYHGADGRVESRGCPGEPAAPSLQLLRALGLVDAQAAIPGPGDRRSTPTPSGRVVFSAKLSPSTTACFTFLQFPTAW